MAFVIRKLQPHASLGEFLRSSRLLLPKTLSEMSSVTKIQRAYLQAFENNQFQLLPDAFYARKLLQTYVRALGADETYALRRFEEESGLPSPSPALPLASPSRFAFLTLHRVPVIATILLFFLGIVGYLGYQVTMISAHPVLVVSEPVDGFQTTSAQTRVVGHAPEDVTVLVNGTPVITKDDGTFETSLLLERGVNTITVEGTKRYSQPTVIYRRVLFDTAPRSVSATGLPALP